MSFDGKIAAPAGLITRGHRVADPQLTPRVMLTLRVSNNTRLVARPRRATKKKKTALIAAGVGVGLVALLLWSR